MAAMGLLAALQTGCGTVRTARQLDDGAGVVANELWDRWIASGGDLAETLTWQRKVADGVSAAQVEQSLTSMASEYNIRAVGELPLSRELEARSGQPQKLLKVYSYCNPATARMMVDHSPAMAAFLPCRISLVERDDGLWLYTLNMDMMIRLNRRLPPALHAEALKVRDALWQMLDRGAKGDF